ncbi:putative plant self-incompatibility S1 [Lupinus albus]|uniref:Putative plant self-incompatibility S1 n=1 Tax=Lupinus albus TaxID=3870 RepID=A0A6A4QGE3_LUPAL|nr:putative plant self-incompatibility S1 [Lupinus albus]
MNAKSVVLLMLLTIFVTLQMMAGVVSGGLFNEIKVRVTNKLSTPLLMECKDGPHMVLPDDNQRLNFSITPFFTYIWTCKFEWKKVSHTYNIYDSRRDGCRNCLWFIKEAGPCKILHKFNSTPVCFSWNY